MNPKVSPSAINLGPHPGKKRVFRKQTTGIPAKIKEAGIPSHIKDTHRPRTVNYDLSLLDVVPAAAKDTPTKTKHVHFLPEDTYITGRPTDFTQLRSNVGQEVAIQSLASATSSPQPGCPKLKTRNGCTSCHVRTNDQSDSTEVCLVRSNIGKSTRRRGSVNCEGDQAAVIVHRSNSLPTEHNKRYHSSDSVTRKYHSKPNSPMARTKEKRSLPATPAATSTAPQNQSNMPLVAQHKEADISINFSRSVLHSPTPKHKVSPQKIAASNSSFPKQRESRGSNHEARHETNGSQTPQPDTSVTDSNPHESHKRNNCLSPPTKHKHAQAKSKKADGQVQTTCNNGAVMNGCSPTKQPCRSQGTSVSASDLHSAQGTRGTTASDLHSARCTQRTSVSDLRSAPGTQGTSVSDLHSARSTQRTSASDLRSTPGTQGTTASDLHSARSTQRTSVSDLRSAPGTQGTSVSASDLRTSRGTQRTTASDLHTAQVTQGTSANNPHSARGTQLQQRPRFSNVEHKEFSNSRSPEKLHAGSHRPLDYVGNSYRCRLLTDNPSFTASSSPSSSLNSVSKEVLSSGVYTLPSMPATPRTKPSQPGRITKDQTFLFPLSELSSSSLSVSSSLSTSSSHTRSRRSPSCSGSDSIFGPSLDPATAKELAQKDGLPFHSLSRPSAGKDRDTRLADISGFLYGKTPLYGSSVALKETNRSHQPTQAKKQSIAASYQLDYCWFCGRPMPAFVTSSNVDKEEADKLADLERRLTEALSEKVKLLEEQTRLKESAVAALEQIEQLQQQLRDERLTDAPAPEVRTPEVNSTPTKDLDLRAYLERRGHQLDICQHVQVTRYCCRGFLHKMGSHFNLWKKRWFVFDSKKNVVSYFTDKTERKPRGTLSLQNVLEVYLDHPRTVKSPDPKVTFCVKIYHRTYYLMAPSAVAMAIWVDILLSAAQGYKGCYDS